LTRFTVKPVIDASLTLDAKLIKKATAFVEIAGEGDAESDSETASSVDIDSEVDAAIADTASAETETESEAESSVDIESEVESAIDAELSADTSAVSDLEAAADAESQAEAEALANAEAEAEADVAVEVEMQDVAEIEIKPIVDGTGTFAHTPKANLTRFTVKPTIDATLALDAKLVKPAAKPTALLEAEGIVRPKIDGTGSIPQGAPRANLTRFTVKPVIDASLTLDAKLVKKTALIEEDSSSFLELERQIYPILDNTGTDSYTPKANLTRFKIKATIDPNFSLDVKLSSVPTAVGTKASLPPLPPVATKPILPPVAVSPAPAVAPRPNTLLEVHSNGDCPGCKNRGLRQDLEVVLSPQMAPGSIDAELNKELHRRVDYLIEPQAKTLNLQQNLLDSAAKQVVDAEEHHIRVYDFAEKHKNQLLIPQRIQDEQEIVQLIEQESDSPLNVDSQ